MKRRDILKTTFALMVLLAALAPINAQRLYTEGSGSNPTFQQLISSGELPTGENTTKGVKGSDAQPVVTGSDKEWSVESLGGNKYRFKNKASNRGYLAATVSGNYVEWTGWNGERSQWILQRVGTNLTARIAPVQESVTPEDRFSIYPNPAENTLSWSGTDFGNASINVYDLSGRTVLSKIVENKSSTNQLDIGSLPKGVYIIEFDDNGETVRKNFIKK